MVALSPRGSSSRFFIISLSQGVWAPMITMVCWYSFSRVHHSSPRLTASSHRRRWSAQPNPRAWSDIAPTIPTSEIITTKIAMRSRFISFPFWVIWSCFVVEIPLRKPPGPSLSSNAFCSCRHTACSLGRLRLWLTVLRKRQSRRYIVALHREDDALWARGREFFSTNGLNG